MEGEKRVRKEAEGLVVKGPEVLADKSGISFVHINFLTLDHHDRIAKKERLHHHLNG